MIEGTDFISLPTRNLERAERFYGETLGLTRSEDDTDFVAFETGNVRVLLVDPDAIGVEFAPNQNGFALRVGDVAEARRELESRGVRFFGEIVDTGVRQMAFFADPDGNGIVLHRRHAALMQVERVDFLAVPVDDLARADAFYGETLGLARNPNGSGDRWVEYETGNLTIALSTFGGALALGVPDVAEGRSELEQAGTTFAMDTFDSGVCNGAPFADPDGNHLQLHRRYAPLEPFDVPAQEIERTDFIGVNVRDRGRGSDFYGGTLGLEQNPLASEEWPEFEAENVGLVLSTPEQKGGGEYRPEYGIAFRVADVGQTMKRLQNAGVEFEFPEVYDSGVCHMGFFEDPDGNALMLHHRYAPYRDGSLP